MPSVRRPPLILCVPRSDASHCEGAHCVHGGGGGEGGREGVGGQEGRRTSGNKWGNMGVGLKDKAGGVNRWFKNH